MVGMTTIRAECLTDAIAIGWLIDSAFSTPAEARLVDALRANANLLVSLVAEADGEVVGHVAFSPVMIGDGGIVARGAGLAPVAVAESWRRQGIAAGLIRAGLDACRALGIPFVVVLGDPAYYSRFGFQWAADYGITNEYGADQEFRIIELVPGSLPTSGGLARYGAEFAALAGEPPAKS
jgi:putative acetyltransferase